LNLFTRFGKVIFFVAIIWISLFQQKGSSRAATSFLLINAKVMPF
jgi:hypothetical protein